MLQQTTVATVKTRFKDFVKKWPTISKLAKTSESRILQFWSGLGYYSRARNLLKAAKIIEKDLANLFKKIKKDKNYFFSMKDLIILESLKSDGIEFPKKTYEYEVLDPNIPYDIQILINREEPGLALLIAPVTDVSVKA